MTFPTNDAAAEVSRPGVIMYDSERTEMRQNKVMLGVRIEREERLAIQRNRLEITVGNLFNRTGWIGKWRKQRNRLIGREYRYGQCRAWQRNQQ